MEHADDLGRCGTAREHELLFHDHLAPEGDGEENAEERDGETPTEARLPRQDEGQRVVLQRIQLRQSGNDCRFESVRNVARMHVRERSSPPTNPAASGRVPVATAVVCSTICRIERRISFAP